MVGNGATDWHCDSWPSYPDTALNFQIIPHNVYNNWTDNECHKYFRDVFPPSNSTICNDTGIQIANLSLGFNYYDLYLPPNPPA